MVDDAGGADEEVQGKNPVLTLTSLELSAQVVPLDRDRERRLEGEFLVAIC